MTAAPAAPAVASGPVRLAVPLAVVLGAVVALQSRVNGALGLALGGALQAAVVSFGTGLVVLVVAVLVRPASRAALPRLSGVPWWSRLGGLGGATLVAVAAAAAPVLGVALLTVGLVAGQTTGGLLVDRAGLGPGGPRPVTAPRAAGAALCLGAVALSAAGRGVRELDPVLLALVVVAGLLVSVQQALNGRVRATTQDAVVTTLLNFGVGTAALGAALLGSFVLGGVPDADWPGLGQAGLYAGGLMGTAFIGYAAVVVKVLGVLRLGLATVAGQLVGAVLLDVVAPLPGTRVSALTVAATALTLVAVGVSGRGGRR